MDEVYDIVNNRVKILHTLSISKSAIRHNMEKELPKIQKPTLLIWGRNDIVTPPEVAVQFHELLPQSELQWIEKCGHAPMMEHPIIFNRLLFEWLGRQEGRTEMKINNAVFVTSSAEAAKAPGPLPHPNTRSSGGATSANPR